MKYEDNKKEAKYQSFKGTMERNHSHLLEDLTYEIADEMMSAPKEFVDRLKKEKGIKEKVKVVEEDKEEDRSFPFLELAQELYDSNPYYYDNSKIWWLWDKNENYWKMVDHHDMFNKCIDELKIDVTEHKIKTRLETSLKLIGRRNKPVEIPKHWIQFKSKIYDLKKDVIFDSSPKYLTTNPIPWDLSESDDTPTIDKIFGEWVTQEGNQDESYIETLYEILSYCCIHDQFLQTVIALTGSGSNGKGTFLNLLTNFVGETNVVSSNLKTLVTRNFETSALYKKLVSIMGEVDSHDLSNTNIIKQLTGEDLIRYEFKGKTPFTDKSPTTCVIATNSLPITPDKSIGFYRRWLIVDFPNQFTVKRDLLGQIPEQEYRNLTRKVINCLKKLYNTNEFTNGGSIEERRSRYEERSNPLVEFVSKYCNENPDQKVVLREFSNIYNQYLQNNRLRPINVVKIGKMLRDEGFETSSRDFKTKDGKILKAKAINSLSFNKKIFTIYQKPVVSVVEGSEITEKLPELLKSSTWFNYFDKYLQDNTVTELLKLPEFHIYQNKNNDFLGSELPKLLEFHTQRNISNENNEFSGGEV